MNGTAVLGERVVIVEVRSGRVNLKTGRVASADSNPVQATHRNEALVVGERQFDSVADNPEEDHARPFRMDDIHLLKEEEAQSLLDPTAAKAWFGDIYQDHLVVKIHRALKRFQSKQRPPV